MNWYYWKTFSKTIEGQTYYQLIKDGIITIPEYNDLTEHQQLYLGLVAGQILVDRRNDSIKLKAIAEAIGVKFKEKKG